MVVALTVTVVVFCGIMQIMACSSLGAIVQSFGILVLLWCVGAETVGDDIMETVVGRALH